MRPRHKAAENGLQAELVDQAEVASMRPRHKAAENLPGVGEVPPRRGRASMRPRHKAAENGPAAVPALLAELASMRPRHKAAENVPRFCLHAGSPARFNEAAA